MTTVSDKLALQSLEGLLETFLDKVVQLKQDKLEVIDGINRLDDIARLSINDTEITDEMGNWFASHNKWLSESVLKPAEAGRVGKLLGDISRRLSSTNESSPADQKIESEINRWIEKTGKGTRKIVLKRRPEDGSIDPSDTIKIFGQTMERMRNLYLDLSGGKAHLLSALDDALKSALVQRNKETLLLAAFIIYYLKQNGYMVEPFVKRLKEAEDAQREERLNA